MFANYANRLFGKSKSVNQYQQTATKNLEEQQAMQIHPSDLSDEEKRSAQQQKKVITSQLDQNKQKNIYIAILQGAVAEAQQLRTDLAEYKKSLESLLRKHIKLIPKEDFDAFYHAVLPWVTQKFIYYAKEWQENNKLITEHCKRLAKISKPIEDSEKFIDEHSAELSVEAENAYKWSQGDNDNEKIQNESVERFKEEKMKATQIENNTRPLLRLIGQEFFLFSEINRVLRQYRNELLRATEKKQDETENRKLIIEEFADGLDKMSIRRQYQELRMPAPEGASPRLTINPLESLDSPDAIRSPAQVLSSAPLTTAQPTVQTAMSNTAPLSPFSTFSPVFSPVNNGAAKSQINNGTAKPQSAEIDPTQSNLEPRRPFM